MIFLNNLNKILTNLGTLNNNLSGISKIFEKGDVYSKSIIPENRDINMEKTYYISKIKKTNYEENEIPYFSKYLFIYLVGGGSDGSMDYKGNTDGTYFGYGGKSGDSILINLNLENLKELYIKTGKRGERSLITFKNEKDKLLTLYSDDIGIRNYVFAYEDYFTPETFLDKFNISIQMELIYFPGSSGGLENTDGDSFKYGVLNFLNNGKKGNIKEVNENGNIVYYGGGGGGGGSLFGKGGNGGTLLEYQATDALGIGAGGGGPYCGNTLKYGNPYIGKGAPGGAIIAYSL